jgi:hypothetical protein
MNCICIPPRTTLVSQRGSVFQCFRLISPEAWLYGQALIIGGVLLGCLHTDPCRFAATGQSGCGLLTPLPAYLTSWGRYTHLAGLIIFCAILALTTQIKAKYLSEFIPWSRYFITSGIALAGLGLVHYRVAAFLVCWWVVLLLVCILQGKVKQKFHVYLATGFCGGVLVLPWFIPALQYTFLPWYRFQGYTHYSVILILLLTSAYGGAVLVTAGLGWQSPFRFAGYVHAVDRCYFPCELPCVYLAVVCKQRFCGAYLPICMLQGGLPNRKTASADWRNDDWCWRTVIISASILAVTGFTRYCQFKPIYGAGARRLQR